MTSLDHVLETYLLRTAGLDSFYSLEDARKKREILREMMMRHPEHAANLMDFAATHSIIQAHEEIEIGREQTTE